MRKIFIAVCAGVCLLFSVESVSALTGTGEIALSGSYIKYEEALMKETGPMVSIDGSYTWHNRPSDQQAGDVMVKLDGRLGYADMFYDGQLQDGTPYEIKNIPNALFETRLCAGFDAALGDNARLTPYAGLGYRFLADNASNDPAGYLRFSNYLYTPLGVEIETSLGDGWALGVTGEFDYFWHGWQISYLSDVNAGFNDVTNEQKRGYGLRGSLRLIARGGARDFVFEPYARYWKIEDSEESNVTFSGTIIGRGIEPENESTEIGARLGIRF